MLDIKSMIFGGVLSLAVGGGLYGTYIKFLAPVVHTQTQAYGLVHQCSALLGSNDLQKIDDFFIRVEEQMEDINESDIKVTVIGLASGQSYENVTGMGKPLAMCLKMLASTSQSLRN